MKDVMSLLIICWLFSPISIHAQDIEVKKFEAIEKDQTATLNPRKDINGVMCGLVKVQLKEPGAEFEGNVMGDVQFTGKEYLVYLPNGTKRLGIKHPDYLPTTIVFADYGTKRIVSSTTYELKLKTNKKQAKVDNSKKGMAVFNIKPSNAMLLIDGQVADGSGGAYTLSLPYGTHYYTVKLSDFALTNQPVKIDKTAKNINVDLTEYFARVDVSCKTEDAELLINNVQKGEGKWGGMMIPGKYAIEARKNGCHSQTRLIELKDNDTVRVDFSALKTITGSLRVDYEPAGSDVLLNGKKVGVTPIVLRELPVGQYRMKICNKYCKDGTFTFNITEDQDHKEEGSLKLSEYGKVYYSAKKGNKDHQFAVANYLRYGYVWTTTVYNLGFEGDGPVDFNDTVSINPIEAVRWYKLAAQNGSEEALREISSNNGGQNDEVISFQIVKKKVEDFLEDLRNDPYDRDVVDVVFTPFAALAWHYFYGIGCRRNVKEADRMIRLACDYYNDKYVGNYSTSAFVKLIHEMGLDKELVSDGNNR